MPSSLVSIIVPCFNQAQYLPDALNSVLAQSFPSWECIIINDGSEDKTEEVSKEFCQGDNRFKYIWKENGGLSSARNAGIKVSSGKYILPLDADDKIAAEYIQQAVNVLDNDVNVKVVYSDRGVFWYECGNMETTFLFTQPTFTNQYDS